MTYLKIISCKRFSYVRILVVIITMIRVAARFLYSHVFNFHFVLRYLFSAFRTFLVVISVFYASRRIFLEQLFVQVASVKKT
jgi:hypothetical protein